MSLPGNGIYVVRGEMCTLMTAMRRGSRWNASAYAEDEKDGLMKEFVELKHALNRIDDLRLIDPNTFLAPFLEVIRTDETTGAVTSLALASIHKFLSYGLIDPTSPNLATIVENIADAVTHARFMGTDQSSDGVTLFRVVEVLHALMRSPEGSALSNESVCEVMLSCFKICFEPRLNELLRRSAEQALKDMVLLLFMRLPQFSEDRSDAGLLKKFQMMAASMEKDKKQKKKQSKGSSGNLHRSASHRDVEKLEDRKASTTSAPGECLNQSPQVLSVNQIKGAPLATTPATPAGTILDMQGKITQTPTTTLPAAAAVNGGDITPTIAAGSARADDTADDGIASMPHIAIEPASPLSAGDDADVPSTAASTEVNQVITSEVGSNEYINSVGVRFTQQNSVDGSEDLAPPMPYGLPCIQELFRFLILICNPMDKQNTDTMMHMGLSLLTVAFEVSADNIGKYDTLLELVKDDLCRNLTALLGSERLSIFAADLQLCFLMFESLRGHLKFQLEAYLRKLSEIIASENPKTPYEMRELALDNLLQLFRIPNFVSELYINYDCDLYCSDIFESLTTLLSKYTLSATNAVYSTHILAMEALLSVIESVERNCIAAKSVDDGANEEGRSQVVSANRHSRQNSELEGIVIDSGPDHSANDDAKSVVENISKFINNSTRARLASGSSALETLLTRDNLASLKEKKRIISQGSELFNQRPDKGIQYLQENGILKAELDPMEVALFLRENPALDKKMIGEYISRKKNVDSKILMNFVNSFDFTGLRVDQALRLYLETFRLPGEAPLIFLVLEHFANHWHEQNGEPFANTDAAFSLAYAIIMLNMDQHNLNAKRLNVPMTQEDFLKNLRKLNGGTDFDQEMLAAIFNAIKNEEIVMPAEQTGIVRENYLWKVLLRRGLTSDGQFYHVHDSVYDIEIFRIVWGATLSALSFMFDKSSENGYQRTLLGFTHCAAICAHHNLNESFDALILTLCKFTTLSSIVQQSEVPSQPHNEIVQAVNFGLNPKAQAAMKAVFSLVHKYGDCLREGWKNILDLFLQLFRLKLLPKSLMEVEDFCEPNGKVQLILEKPSQKQEAGLFSSLYSYLSSEGQREPSAEEQEFIKIGKKCIRECQLDQIIQESKFVQLESLHELLKCLLALIKPPTANKNVGLPYAEDVVVFWMELLVRTVIQNRDRMIPLWTGVRDQMYLLLMGGSSCGYDYLLNRSIVAVLKLAIYLMRNEELCPMVLQSLRMLLMLKPAVLVRISQQISIGIYELLKTSAQNIHSEQDWQIIFSILECVGAGAVPPEFEDAALPQLNGNGTKSDGALSSEEDSGLPERGYTSDSEVSAKLQQKQIQSQTSSTGSPFPPSPTGENWILVNKDADLSTLSRPQSPPSAVVPPLCSLVYNCKLTEHLPFALFKCWDSLAFIVRNVAHITPYNFEPCVRCIRTFVEACRDGGIRQRRKFEAAMAALAKESGGTSSKKKAQNKRSDRGDPQRRTGSGDSHDGGVLSAEEAELAQRYEQLSIQLLDLMYTLYTRTAQIFRWWAEEGCAMPQCSALWAQGWCPLLQGIARFAMDRRSEVRTYAISCLQQRALLVHDLQSLSGAEWASCFHQVLFPLLNELLPDSPSVAHLEASLLEESRIRIATIMSKVFLHHLTPLIGLGSAFNDLWLEILNYIEKFMRVRSDLLSEQMQEILKNMLLVMHSVRVFHNDDGSLKMPLWELTWRRIGEFLPNLKGELFGEEGDRAQVMTQQVKNVASVAASQNDATTIPPVTILPQVQTPEGQAQYPSASPSSPVHLVSQVPIMSPVESPRQSIILPAAVAAAGVAPLTGDSINGQPLILGQMMAPQSVPVLVPQPQQEHQSDQQSSDPQPLSRSAATSPPISLYNPLMMPPPTSMLVQPVPVMAVRDESQTVVTNASPILPDLITVASQAAPTKNIDDAAPSLSTDNSKCENANGNDVSSHSAASLPQLNSNHVSNSFNSFSIDLPETPTAINVYGDQNHVMASYEAANIHQDTSDAGAPATNDAPEPKVPMSHLLAGNQYPSLSKIPNAAIVQSFVPMFVPPVQQSSPFAGDIYQEYVQNPYNLTLPEQSGESHQQQPQQQQQQQQQHFSNLAANYFSANIDPSAIPPGSELLYGNP